MEALLPNTPQFITSIVHQLSKFLPPAPPAPPARRGGAAAAAAALPHSNNNRQHQHHYFPPTDENTNPLTQLPPPLLSKVKPLLLTLHCLFPNELLLALDILDRKGIRSYGCYNHTHESEEAAGEQRQRGGDIDGDIYFVRSSSSPSFSSSSSSYSPALNTTRPNGSKNNPPKAHLVCLNAWNCSCEAFALAAFRHLDSPQIATEAESSGGEDLNDSLPTPPPRCAYSDDDHDAADYGGYHWRNHHPSTSTLPFPFGGTLTRNSMKNMHYGTPVCKHLLACLLGSQCPALFGDGIERVYVDGGIEGEGVVAGRFAAA